MTNVTIFKNLGEIASPHIITLSEALDRIKTGRSQQKIESIRRKLFLGEDYSVEKKDLPFVVFSAAKTQAVVSKKGHQTHREDASVVEHSGLFVLDFDNVDVELKKEQLRRDSYIYAIWTGPSGTGVKALVKCPANLEAHSLYYNAFIMKYPDLDSTSKNIARGTFESYDPDLWVNEKSLIWDKRVSEEDRLKIKQQHKDRRGTQIKATAVSMVRAAVDGEKHVALRDAAVLLGGAVAIGKVTKEEATNLLETEIKQKDIQDLGGAQKTIQDGLSYGQQRPLLEIKKLEKAQKFLRREDGSYTFLADNHEMDEYLKALIGGYLEQGLPLIDGLSDNWVLKKNTLVFFLGSDGVGKSFLLWYLAVLAAMLYKWKIIIHSAENNDGELRKKLMEFYYGRSIKTLDDEELTLARDFINEHFRIVSSTQMHSIEEFLLKCEILIDEGFDASLTIGEPWNSFNIPVELDSYRNNIHSLNLVRVFKESYCSCWFADHVNTAAGRLKDKDGFMLAPSKADVEFGVMKNNKSDDFLIVHRQANHPIRKRDTQVHVGKVKSYETGGHPTTKDEPIIIEMNEGWCGYTCNGKDVVKEYWQKRQL